MDLVHLLVVLVIIGLVCWLIKAYILPRVGEPLATIIVVLGVLLLILWLLSLIGYVPPLRTR